MKSIHILLILLLTVSLSSPQVFAQKKIKVDYKTIAREITEGAVTNEEKAKAIYQHLCETIEYDVEMKIATPEECYTYKKGICQAYALLFTELCKAVKVKCIYVSGVTKDTSYNMEQVATNTTHGYLLVEGDNKDYFYVDPTWGAGVINDGAFVRKVNMSWFKVEPEWMIFSHYPQDPKNQLLNEKLTMEEFLAMPDLRPHLKYYGFDGKKLLKGFKEKTITSMPEVSNHSSHINMLTIEEVPLTHTLEVGVPYNFTVRKKKDVKYALVHNDNIITDWNETDENVSKVYTPDAPGRLYVAFQNLGDEAYYEVISYLIPSPTPEKLNELIAKDPYFSPQLQALPNYTPKMKEMGFDGAKILEGIQSKEVTGLPKTFSNKFTGYRIIDFPCNGNLKVGTEYRFMIDAPKHFEMALFYNNEYHADWNSVGSSMSEIRFTPRESGAVTINIRRKGEERFYAILGYDIDEPSEEEWAILASEDPYYSRELRGLKGYSADLQSLRFDGKEILRGIREGTITEFPENKFHHECVVRVLEVPLNRFLMRDSTYVFSLVIPGGETPALTFNGNSYRENWMKTDGIWEITFTPKEEGELNISVENKDKGLYYSTLKYDVIKPFKTKKMIISECLSFLSRQNNVLLAAVGEDGLPKMTRMQVLKYTAEELYFAISAGEELYWQLKSKPRVELMGMHENESIRINGDASFTVPNDICSAIYEENEVLKSTVDDYKKLKFFTVKIENAEYNKEETAQP
ncbi:pyridoxamine 5'-phosphate oxidase family protein [Bacteroides sp. OttesenSCG-928-N06]|nr:pyridoxamine 5'-phosphate oxidase family protein [Bacteroides sp. OttesenSCG-928-N06]